MENIENSIEVTTSENGNILAKDVAGKAGEVGELIEYASISTKTEAADVESGSGTPAEVINYNDIKGSTAAEEKESTNGNEKANDQAATDDHDDTEGAVDADEVSEGTTENGIPQRNFSVIEIPKSAEASFMMAEKRRTVLIGKSKQLNEVRYEIAGHVAKFIHDMDGDETAIRPYVEQRGVTWPLAQCKRPSQHALSVHFILAGEEGVNLKSRISEWSKVLVVLGANKVFGKEAVAFITKHGGVKGVYAGFDNNGHQRREPTGTAKGGKYGGGMTDEEVESVLARTIPAGTSRVEHTFPLIVGRYSVALLRVDSDDPQVVEIIDSLDLGEPAVRKAMTKLAKTLKAVNVVTSGEE